MSKVNPCFLKPDAFLFSSTSHFTHFLHECLKHQVLYCIARLRLELSSLVSMPHVGCITCVSGVSQSLQHSSATWMIPVYQLVPYLSAEMIYALFTMWLKPIVDDRFKSHEVDINLITTSIQQDATISSKYGVHETRGICVDIRHFFVDDLFWAHAAFQHGVHLPRAIDCDSLCLVLGSGQI